MVAILPNAPAGHLGHGLQLRAVLSSQHTAPSQMNRVLLQIFTNVKTLSLSLMRALVSIIAHLELYTFTD